MTPGYQHYHETLNWHIADITSRIIAKSGIPSDRFHLGKLILQALEDDPDRVAQIEGITGASETNRSVLQRSIQCAIGLQKLGFKKGDVMILMAPNHLDLVVPYYAALYTGIIIAPIDRFLGINELADNFTVNEPKIIFCQSEKVDDIKNALQNTKNDTKVITFDEGKGDTSLAKLLEQADLKCVKDFRPTDFDPEETIAMLVPTSGTTGLPKSSISTHKNFAIMSPYVWSRAVQIPPYERSMVVAPLQWLSAILNFLCGPFVKFTRLQTEKNLTQKLAYEIINKYRPSCMISSPPMMTTFVRPGDRDVCDFTCFERIILGGSVVHTSLIEEIRKVSPNTEVTTMYGMTEAAGVVFIPSLWTPPLSCGKPIGCLQYRLVDVETEDDIDEPNVSGELLLKGPGLCKGYYNNPEITKQAYAGGWFKSGDLFYRDENWNFFFVERIKLLLKYRNHQIICANKFENMIDSKEPISPVEVEGVIRQHPGVLDVAVTSVPDAECGDLPVACVLRRDPTLTAHDIKDIVKATLTDTKQLRGGVVFMKELPVTSSTKIHRMKLRKMVLTMTRE